MKRRSLKYPLAFICAVAAFAPASAQVPIEDLLRSIKNATQRGISEVITDKDTTENAKRDDIAIIQQQQIKALEEAIASMTTGTFAPLDMENMAAAPVEAAYDITVATGEESRLFGDGRVTIEQMIVETVQKYKNHPALGKAGISPVGFRAWFQALVKQESRFQVAVCSHAGACGLTQIMPGTFTELGIPQSQRNDPRVQLDGGARYLLKQLNRFGSMPLALAAYNAGPGAVMKYNGIPPYAETQDYVMKITGYANQYAAVMGSPNDLGTMSGNDMVLAELGNMADAGMQLGYGFSQQLELSARRVKSLIEQIPNTKTTREAIDLNTYLRGEITRLASMITIMEATQRKIEAQRFGAIYQAQIKDEEFMTLTGGESADTGG